MGIALTSPSVTRTALEGRSGGTTDVGHRVALNTSLNSIGLDKAGGCGPTVTQSRVAMAGRPTSSSPGWHFQAHGS